jgi:hypothetical protein
MVLAKPMTTFNANGEFRTLRATQLCSRDGDGTDDGGGKTGFFVDVDIAKHPSVRRVGNTTERIIVGFAAK